MVASRWLALVLGAGLVACDSRAATPAMDPVAPPVAPAAPALGAAASIVAARPLARFTIATYNINAGMAGDADTLAALAALGTDVVVLQEASRDWERPIRTALADAYAHIEFRTAGEPWGGLAVLSRLPITSEHVLRPAAGPFPAWRLTIETAIGPVQLLDVHLFPPVRWAERGWLRAYHDSQVLHVQELEGFFPSLDAALPTVIIGDFNEAAGGRANQWLEQRGFVTALPGATPTWRWTTEAGTVRWQLDNVVFRGVRLVEARVVEDGSSDHLPIRATFEAGPGPTPAR